jgi:hypothetical protein
MTQYRHRLKNKSTRVGFLRQNVTRLVMYKYYKLLIKTQYDFASIMHFLLLLPALVACTAGECYKHKHG